jgi:hypothetical protein
MFWGNKMKDTVLAYQRLFDTEDGKKVLKDLMKSCGFDATIVGKDSHETYYNEGARSVVLRIVQNCGLSVDNLTKMIKEMEEHYEDQNNDF